MLVGIVWRIFRATLWRRPRAWLLDTLLGPAEDWDYVSRTAPATPPPAY